MASYLGGKKDIKAKHKISLEGSEASGVEEGPSDSRSKRVRASFEKDWFGKSEGVRTELSKQPTALHRPKPRKKEKKKNNFSTALPEPGLCIKSKDPETPGLAQPWNDLEQIIKTLADLTLETEVEETQTAVLNVRQKNKKCAPKEIQVLKKDLQDLQDQLCTEQEQQQQHVEHREKTFCKEGAKEEEEEKLKEQLAQVLMQCHAVKEELNRNKKDFEEIIKAKDRKLKETKGAKEEAEEKLKKQLAQVLKQCHALIKELNRNKKDFEEIIKAKDKELKETKGAKEEGEEKLKEQLAQVLKQCHALIKELNHNKKNFEEIIKAKDKELKETKEEKERVRAQKEEALNQMNDVLENELQCTVCSEYFIEAVTLNCAHSFCNYCINRWMKRKLECPICRGFIEFKTRSLVLDNCIDRVVENLDDETKQHHLSLIQERKGQQAVLETTAPECESNSFISSSDSESGSETSALDSETSSITSIHSILSISSYESDYYEGDSDN